MKIDVLIRGREMDPTEKFLADSYAIKDGVFYIYETFPKPGPGGGSILLPERSREIAFFPVDALAAVWIEREPCEI
jgi:hypothetical protein